MGGDRVSQYMNVKETVVIHQLTKGIVVSVGCHSIAIDDSKIEDVMADVTRLLREGRAKDMWKKYFPEDFAINKKEAVDTRASQCNEGYTVGREVEVPAPLVGCR